MEKFLGKEVDEREPFFYEVKIEFCDLSEMEKLERRGLRQKPVLEGADIMEELDEN